MDILLTIIHLIACFILVIVVLVQKGKGADLAGAFGGGGSQTVLGVRSATQIIHKMTIAAAIFFMITSYSLGLIQSSHTSLAAEIESEAVEAPAQDDATPEGEQSDDAATPDAENPESSEDTNSEVPSSDDNTDDANPPSEEDGSAPDGQ